MDAVTKHTLGPGKGETASLELTLWSVGSRLSMTFDLPEGSAWLMQQQGEDTLKVFSPVLEAAGKKLLSSVLEHLSERWEQHQLNAYVANLREQVAAGKLAPGDFPDKHRLPPNLRARVAARLGYAGAPAPALPDAKPEAEPARRVDVYAVAKELLALISADKAGNRLTLKEWCATWENFTNKEKAQIGKLVSLTCEGKGVEPCGRQQNAVLYTSSYNLRNNKAKPAQSAKVKQNKPAQPQALAGVIDAITERIANDMRGVALPLNLWWPDWGSLAEHAQKAISAELYDRALKGRHGVSTEQVMPGMPWFTGTICQKQLPEVPEPTMENLPAVVEHIKQVLARVFAPDMVPLAGCYSRWMELTAQGRTHVSEQFEEYAASSHSRLIVSGVHLGALCYSTRP